MHIATALELWFEKLGNSPPAAPPADERGPLRGALSGAGFDLKRRSPVRPGRDRFRRRSNDDDAGA